MNPVFTCLLHNLFFRSFKMNLLKDFSNINSPLFGETNINKVYHDLKKKSITEPATIASIQELQSRVEAISKMKQRYLIRNEKRKYSYRKWLSFGPRHLLISDLAFIRRLNSSPNDKNHRVLFLIMDHYSRLIFLKFQRNRSSSETLKSFKQSLNFFTKNNSYPNTYRKLCVDQGGKCLPPSPLHPKFQVAFII